MIKPTFMSACQMHTHSKSFAVDMHIYSEDNYWELQGLLIEFVVKYSFEKQHN